LDLDQNNDMFLEDFPLNFTADLYIIKIHVW